MKGKPKGGAAGKVASSTLAYPGNPFKYSPKCPTDEPEQKLNTFDVTTCAQKCDEIYSLSEEDTSGSGGQNQEQLQSEKVIVEVLHKVEKDIWEMEHFSKEHAKGAKNGPKIYKNSSVAASERC